MVISHLIGGLGNQMFQYALGRKIAINNNIRLMLDISGLENHSGNGTPRKYSLGVFNIEERFSDKKEVAKFKPENNSKITRTLAKKFALFKSREYFIAEPYFNFCPDILNTKKGSYLQGYWQTEKYFKDIEDVIRNEFTLKDEYSIEGKEITQKIKNCNAVSLHIRRGDYVTSAITNKFHGICSLDYYGKAIKRIADNIQNPHFFIFSDDIEWVKQNLKIDFPVEYVSNGTLKDYEELMLMSYCKHNIIANSSFSWWGAWLNNNPEKIVIAPRRWFADVLVDTSDVVPETWIKM